MERGRIVIGYHGCNENVAKRVLDGEPLKASKNDYDWLGHGVYFWEFGAIRALEFVRESGLPTPVLHDLGDGGYVMFAGGPGSVFVDGRVEIYGAEIEVRDVLAEDWETIPP